MTKIKMLVMFMFMFVVSTMAQVTTPAGMGDLGVDLSGIAGFILSIAPWLIGALGLAVLSYYAATGGFKAAVRFVKNMIG